MSSPDGDRDWRRFEAGLREWAAREPRTPPEQAARRVLERLDARRPTAGRWWLAAAAVLAVVALLGFWWAARRGSPAPTAVGTVYRSPLAPEGVVLWWIDPDTPVYFVLGPERPLRGGVR